MGCKLLLVSIRAYNNPYNMLEGRGRACFSISFVFCYMPLCPSRLFFTLFAFVVVALHLC